MSSLCSVFFQLGGDFLLDNTGKVLLSHPSKSPLDRLSLTDVLQAAAAESRTNTLVQRHWRHRGRAALRRTLMMSRLAFTTWRGATDAEVWRRDGRSFVKSVSWIEQRRLKVIQLIKTKCVHVPVGDIFKLSTTTILFRNQAAKSYN